MPFMLALGTISSLAAHGAAALTPQPRWSIIGGIIKIAPVINLGQSNRNNSTISFAIVNPKIHSVLTPGFVTNNLSIPSLTASVTMGVQSADVVKNGLLTAYSYGLQTVVQGPPDGLQLPLPSLGLATIIAASGSTTSPVIPSYYYPHLVMGITSSQTGALNVQRYIDVQGTIAQGTALTAALTAATAAVLDSADGKGFGSFTIQVTNTGTASATVSGLVVLLLAR